ncbi:BA75_02259T0 [Komagataella pastoris]|uniref:H/ACA ribonucleoprotein complex non-core subunit NAF1 n=1 Tax=Komagataella pastoris TaxID=4922 RepID=A0A1B2JA74_PICPA|nr:BA75_02259T0 [Komagataella pastoris]
MSDNDIRQPDKIAQPDEIAFGKDNERDTERNSIPESLPTASIKSDQSVKDSSKLGSGIPDVQYKEEQKGDFAVGSNENREDPETFSSQNNLNMIQCNTLNDDQIFLGIKGSNPSYSSDDCSEALNLESSSNENSNSDQDSDSDSGSDSESETELNSLDANDQIADSDDETSPAAGPIRSKNEVVDEQAPELPKDLVIDESTPVELIGEISACVERSVVIKAYASGEFRILKENSVLCLEDRTILGPLFEIFGKLETPFYRVKYNSVEEFDKFKHMKGTKVYYLVPQSEFQYTEKIKSVKGTDASNWHDEEIPEEEQEFSDDEKERAFKQSKKKKKNKNKNKTTRYEDKNAGEPSAKRRQNPVPNGYTNFTQLPIKYSVPQNSQGDPPVQQEVLPTKTQAHPLFETQSQVQHTSPIQAPELRSILSQSQPHLQQPAHSQFASHDHSIPIAYPQNYSPTSTSINYSGMNSAYDQPPSQHAYHPSQPYGVTQTLSQNNQALQDGMSLNTASMSESELKLQLQMQFQIMNQLASQLNQQQQQQQNSRYTTGQLPPYNQRKQPPPGNN